MRVALNPETMKINDLKFEFRNFSYEKLLTKAVGQQLLIDDYEKGLMENFSKIDKASELIQKMQLYLNDNKELDRDMLIAFVEEIRKTLH